jgi:Tol biopolymer transport system component
MAQRTAGGGAAGRFAIAAFALIVAATGLGLVVRATHRSVSAAGLVPSGTSVAYVARRNGDTALIAASSDGRTLRVVTLAGGVVPSSAPSWSADGAVVAFVTRSDRPSVTSITVWRSGGTVQRLTDCCLDGSPAVSADARTVAFVRHTASGDEILAMNRAGGADARTICSPGACGQGIADLTWSPDGRTLAFSHAGLGSEAPAGDRDGGIDVIDADGTAFRRLTSCGPSHCSPDLAPSWSPDGRAIAYNHGGGLGHGQRIRVVDVRTGTVHTIAACPQPHCLVGMRPVWSPDGSAIAFPAFNTGSGNPGIVIVTVVGRARTMVSTCGGGACLDPGAIAFSPDGSALAFVRVERSGDVVKGEGLDVVPMHGGAPQPLASGAATCCPAWIRSAGAPVSPSAG